MLVTIVYVPTPDLRGPDRSRMEKVEEIPDELARVMLGDGTARVPSEEELAAFEEAQAVEAKSVDVPADGQQAEEPTRAPRVDGRRSRPATQTEPAAEAAQ